MLQNSLDRLFHGMAATLHERVLPSLDDGAVVAQVRAMIELLGNLSTRVSWDVGYLASIRDHVQPALAEVAGFAGAPGTVGSVLADAPAPVIDPEAVRREVTVQLEALADAQAWLGGADPETARARVAVDEFIDWYLAEEFARLRSASYARPRTPE